MNLIKPILVVILFSSAIKTYGQAGSLDLSFGLNGKVLTDIGPGDDKGFAIAIQTNGRILVAGTSDNGSNVDFAVVRYDMDGLLDNTFGSDGKVTTDFNGHNDLAFAIAIQQDEKIIVAGPAHDDSLPDIALARYKSDGTLDTTFGVNGKVQTDINNTLDRARDIVLQPDGKIIVVGYFDSPFQQTADFFIVRYNPNGTLDGTFGTAGKDTTSIGINSDQAFAVALQPDGKIVVAGESYKSNGNGNDYALIRYNSNGMIDSTFGTNGITTTDVKMWDPGRDVAIQQDGKILLTGWTEDDTQDYIGLVRYSSEGLPDSTFGINGITIATIEDVSTVGSKLTMQSDGKTLVCGYSNSGANDFALLSFKENGALDSTFASDGIVTTSFGPGDDQGLAIALQADGKIVVAGQSSNGGNLDIAVARFNSGLSVSSEEMVDDVNSFQLYPNPTRGKFVLSLSQPANDLSIYDQLGQVIFRKILYNEIQVELYLPNKGIYFVKVGDQDNVFVKKLIVH